MNVVLKVLAVLLVSLVLIGAGVYGWASMSTSRTLARTFDVHTVDFPVPFPLEADELTTLESAEDADAIATARAVERGRHLVQARYACTECHGADLGGGVMVDAFPIGRLLGPNITSGAGSKTRDYTPADWDRIVRHGVLPDGRPSAMPSVDFQLMSDQELSDIVAYLRTLPPVGNEVPPVKLGPLGKLLVATGQIPLSADVIGAHDRPHAAVPPPTEVSVDFGRHLAAVCTGCHGQELTGGPIPGGDPNWPPARNLTPHADGLAEWSYDDFVAAMREERRPDGTPIREPMAAVSEFANNMTDVELQALWTYLQSVPARATESR